jgi:putative transposase
MKRSRYGEEQVVGILREAQGGMTTRTVCARHNISEQTFYNWKRKSQGMEVNDVRAMRAMAEEISRLKRIVADQVVQIDILKAVNAKKW